MRTEKEMFDLILSVSSSDERIRAVYMNGSRANLNVSKDIYQDYDIVFMVTETKSFLSDKNWIAVFGEPAIIQEPNREAPETYYTWLMLFKDGNRIDLHIRTKEYAISEYIKDSLTVPLLDKDNCLPEIPPTNDSDYHVKRPEESQYKSRCNDFWWCLQNVAKGIARDQLTYAMWMYNAVVRENMTKVIDWYIGINTDFSVSVGMSGKYYKKYLPENIYSLFTKTYSGSDYNDLWAAIFNACELFRIIAPPVGKHFGFTYNQEEDTNMMEYLNWVKASCQNEILSSKQNTVEFWQAIDKLVAESEMVIDRPKGSRHPRYPDIIYQVDYGYLKGTTSMDGGGIDVWKGTRGNPTVDAVMCIVDLVKRDSEIKLLFGCTEEEKNIVYRFHNESEYMKGILIERKELEEK